MNVGSIEYYIDANTRGLLRAERDVTRSTKRMEGRFDTVDKSANRLNRSLNRLSGVAAAVIGAVAIRQLVSYADAFTNVQNRLKVVTDSSEELADVTQKLANIARDSRSNFESAAVLYSRTARATEELGISQQRLLGITETITKSFTLSGATAIEASNAIRQLSQGLASGALRGEEFNSVAEQAPEILRAVAVETGKSVGELREFAAEGGITAELLISAVENYAGTVEREFAKSNATFGQSAEVARTNAVEFVGASDLISSSVSAAGSSLVALSENLDLVEDALLGVAALLAGRYVGAFTESIAALGAKVAANQRLAVSELNAAKEANRRALAEQAAGQRSLANAKNETLRAAALDRLAAANQRVIATQNALNGATARYTKVATAAGRAATLLRGAMGVLGGPAGVIFLATSALIAFNSEADNLPNVARESKTRIDELAESFRSLSDNVLDTKARQAQDSFSELNSETLALRKELAILKNEFEESGSVLNSTAYAEYQKRVAALTKQIEENTAKTDEQREIIEAVNKLRVEERDALLDKAEAEQKAAGATNEMTKEYKKVEQAIADEILKLREGEKAYENAIALRQAGVEATSEEGKALLRLLDIRRQLQQQEEDKERRKEADADKAQAISDLQQELTLLQMRNELNSQDYQTQLAIANIESQGIQLDGGEKDKIAEMIAQMDELKFKSELVGQSLQEAFRGTLISSIDQFSDGIARIVTEGASATEVFRNLANTIATELLSSIIRYYVGQAAAALLGMGQTTAAGVAQASALTAAYTPAAIAANIASFGGAATAAAATAPVAATATTAAIASGSILGGGRLYGGETAPGKLYPITEDGRPEILTEGNKQYLLPGSRGNVTSNRDMQGMGGSTVNIDIINNASGMVSVSPSSSERDGQTDIKFVIDAVRNDILEGGKTYDAIKQRTNAGTKTG